MLAAQFVDGRIDIGQISAYDIVFGCFYIEIDCGKNPDDFVAVAAGIFISFGSIAHEPAVFVADFFQFLVLFL